MKKSATIRGNVVSSINDSAKPQASLDIWHKFGKNLDEKSSQKSAV